MKVTVSKHGNVCQFNIKYNPHHKYYNARGADYKCMLNEQ